MTYWDINGLGRFEKPIFLNYWRANLHHYLLRHRFNIKHTIHSIKTLLENLSLYLNTYYICIAKFSRLCKSSKKCWFKRNVNYCFLFSHSDHFSCRHVCLPFQLSLCWEGIITFTQLQNVNCQTVSGEITRTGSRWINPRKKLSATYASWQQYRVVVHHAVDWF